MLVARFVDKFDGTAHTIIFDLVHPMRQFWSKRSNKGRQFAQTLRFE
jgi:hypothetical protein